MSNYPPGCDWRTVSDPDPLPWWKRPYPEEEDEGDEAAEAAERRQREEQ